MKARTKGRLERGSRGKPKRSSRRLVKFFAAAVLVFCLVSIAEVLTIRFCNPPLTVYMACRWLGSGILPIDEEGEQDVQPIHWRTLKEISPHLIRAVLASEDQRFLDHHGFDLVELEDAVRDMVSSGRTRGASTITMQVARTVFLWPSRTWLRKVLEAYYTILLELMCPKKRILEVYLNTVDWGKGIVGADSASRKYFLQSPRELSPPDAAILAAVLPNPRLWSPVNPTQHLRERQRKILKEMDKMPLSPIFR